jgi:hypothetical protein
MVEFMNKAYMFKLVYSLSAFVIFALASCKQSGSDFKIFEALSDFTFVGSGKAKFLPDGSMDRLYVVPHGIEAQTLPKKLEREVEYVFHHRSGIDDEFFALKEFPDRLSRTGFRIINAPQSSRDLMALYAGGPLFTFRFGIAKREALFFNQIDAKLRKSEVGWNGEDYVLILIKDE